VLHCPIMSRRLGFLVLALLAASGCTSDPPVKWAFDPTREEGIHADVQVEWWYHWGYLTDESGGEWCCFSAFFRTWKEKFPITRYYLYDLTNFSKGSRQFRSAAGAEILPLVTALSGETKLPSPHAVIPGVPLEKPGDPLKLRYGDDLLERIGPGSYRLKTGEVDVTLRAVAEPMAVEGTGLTGIATPDDMHYYPLPRLEAKGTVRGAKARGVFWYDHQWGATWTGPKIGWSWWGLQLDDGSHVNAYVLRDVKTKKLLRAVCTHDRKVYPLQAEPIDFWESRSKVRYPVAWRLKAGPLDLEIEPRMKEREVPILGEQESIWEGPVRVTGSISGRGFQELVSYARERKRAD
jgi:predicted secreted hydrolase